MPRKSPLADRAGLRSEAPNRNALARDLGQLAKKHHLRGAVLISFTDTRVGVNSSGDPDSFGREMETLGDRILAAIDDGQFDPAPRCEQCASAKMTTQNDGAGHTTLICEECHHEQEATDAVTVN